MSLRPSLQNTALVRLLALALLLASTLVAGHVHADEDVTTDISGEQIESCFTYHQFQSHDQALPNFVAFYQANESHSSTAALSIYVGANHLLPPARAPPIVS